VRSLGNSGPVVARNLFETGHLEQLTCGIAHFVGTTRLDIHLYNQPAPQTYAVAIQWILVMNAQIDIDNIPRLIVRLVLEVCLARWD
jgi:hypothetical protein